MHQIGLYYNHYNNNNTTNTNNISLNLQNDYLEKHSLQHQNLDISTTFEQQNNNIFIPASSSSSCSTFSSSPSVSPNPCMSPPVLRKEDNQDWDVEKDNNNDVFMPELEPQVLLENNNNNDDEVFLPIKTTNESSQYNIKNRIFIHPSLNTSKFFNLSDISSPSFSTSSTSSGIWSSTTEPLLILANKN